MTASLSGVFSLQEFDSLGAMAVGGRIYTYTQGTTTQKVAYTDAAGAVAHTYTSDGSGGFYIALNARGELPAPLYLTTGSYDIAYKTAAGATVWTRRADPIGDVLSISTPVWNAASGALVYVDATHFTIAGDQRTTFAVGTRVRFAVTAGTGYASVSAVAFGATTSVTLVNDSALVLDSGLSAVAVSTLIVAEQNVSAGAAAYNAALTYPAGSVGAALQSKLSSSGPLTGVTDITMSGTLTGASLIRPGASNASTVVDGSFDGAGGRSIYYGSAHATTPNQIINRGNTQTFSDVGGTVFAILNAAGKIGPNAAQQHTMPAVASDTYTLNAAAQTLTNKAIGTTLTYTGAFPTVASGATIAASTPWFFVSGTTAIVNITPTAAVLAGGGTIVLIPTGLWTTTAAGNIALASTAVVSKALFMTYDATTTKWYPSYT